MTGGPVDCLLSSVLRVPSISLERLLKIVVERVLWGRKDGDFILLRFLLGLYSFLKER